MFKRNEKYYPWLVPYAEGELDEARASELRARLADDPALAGEAERLGRMLRAVRETARRSPAPETASVPAALWPRLRDRLGPAPAPRRAAPGGWLAAVGAAAALAFAAVWLPLRHTPRVVPPARPVRIAKADTPARPREVASLPPSERLHAAAPPSPAAVPAHRPAPASVPKPAAPRPPAPALSPRDPFAVAKAAAPPIRLVPVHLVPIRARLSPPVAVSRKPVLMASRPTDAGSLRASGGMAAGRDAYALPPARPIAGGSGGAASPAPAHTPAPPVAAPPVVVAGAVHQAAAPADSDALISEGRSSRREAVAAKSPSPGPAALPSGANMPLAPPLHTARKAAAPVTANGSGEYFAADAGPPLDAWQAALAQAEQPPLLGQEEGATQANQALMSARESGSLDALRERLEAKRAAASRDLVTARMLAAVYDFGFSPADALRERRRLAALDGATGEDWFALAEAEGHAGNGQAARAAYRQALEAPAPLSGFHALLARGRG